MISTRPKIYTSLRGVDKHSWWMVCLVMVWWMFCVVVVIVWGKDSGGDSLEEHIWFPALKRKGGSEVNTSSNQNEETNNQSQASTVSTQV